MTADSNNPTAEAPLRKPSPVAAGRTSGGEAPAVIATPPAVVASVMMLLEDVANAGLLSECLREQGYRNVVMAEQPGQARQLLLSDLPDLLLLDADLPGEGGLDLLEWIRSERLLKNTVVIVLADSSGMNRKLRALELGAADFLEKPVDARELGLRMRNLLARSVGRAAPPEEDALTGLTNRQRFNIILDWALTYAKRMGVIGAVLQIGIDRFSQVNEALGPSVGDLLLQAVAQRLSQHVRETDVVSGVPEYSAGGHFGVSLSRIGGDEFSVLLPVMQRAEQAASVAMRIQYAMAAPFQVAGHELIVTCSIGIAVFPSDGLTRDLILGNAGAAMAHAKQQGRDRHEFYGEEMNNRSLARLALERDLRLALERNEFSLVYQPKVGVKAGGLAGAETLLRWRHPQHGMVSPAVFIPIAEEIDLINPLGEWVLRNACRQIQAWQAAGIKAPRISINVSARQIHDPGFEKTIRRVLEECRIKGSSVVLELTESALMKDPDRAVSILKSLREMGIGISIDDFGTGYSSLAYLRRFPLDELKIDRSFLLESNEDSVAIASAIIALGHSLRLNVVAEGVEHETQLEFLRSRDCDEYQGYYFSKPISADAFEMLLRTGEAGRGMKVDSVQRWLEGHCQRLDEVAGGVVLAQNAAGELQMVAEWPAATTTPAPLSAGLTTVAKEAVRRAKPLVLVPAVVQKDAGHSRVIALPLRDGDKIIGAAALAVRSNDANVAKSLLDELERVSPAIAEGLATPAAAAPAIVADKLLKVQDTVASAADLTAAAQDVVNHIAGAYQLDRVSVGVFQDGALNVAAISHGTTVDDRQDLVRGIADAMEEAADQNAPVQYPGGLQEIPRIVQAHARLAGRTGTALCTVPMSCGGKATGALTFERKGATPLPAGDRNLCIQLAAILAPVLEMKRQADRAWWLRAVDGLKQSWQRRGERNRRVALGGALLAAAVLFLLPVTFHVGAPARVEGSTQRVLAAPMDGFLRSTRVRPGDSVKKGDVLVELADQELLLEKRKWESELARHQNNFSFAMGRSDRAQFAINYARAAEAKAQLELVESQLARAQVLAPMDAQVIQGDLTQAIGAPIKRGDTLMTLAPRDQYRIIVEVDERDIEHVSLGQNGRLALSALPGETLHFTVQRITPVATVTRDGRNVFDVEGKLDAGSTLPRHGLQGVAKIEAGRHSLAWIGTRRVVDWLRLGVWSWMP